jgi:phosphomevalonate kinase
LRMCDVDCGSQTVGMVKKVLAWREAKPADAKALWGSLQARNDELAATLREKRLGDLAGAVARVRELVRAMGDASAVPIEPSSQTRLLDALSEIDGVYGGVAPGAGGYDALALLMRDDEATKQRVREFLERWRWDEEAETVLGKVRLLGVRGEMQGARTEDLAQYQGWI